MIKQTLLCTALIASFGVSPALASGGVEYTEEDEASAYGRVGMSGAEYGTDTEAKAMLNRAIAAVRSTKVQPSRHLTATSPSFVTAISSSSASMARTESSPRTKLWLGRMRERSAIKQASRLVSKCIGMQKKASRTRYRLSGRWPERLTGI